MKQDILSGNNDADIVETSLKYTQAGGWTGAVEGGNENDGNETEGRNWLDGIYGEKNVMPIKYPVFMGTTYSMNYININDEFLLAKELNKKGNPYGLNENNVDSHLIKNSEWGAIAYLTESKYGLNKSEVLINNINFNSGNRKREERKGQSGLDSVYAMSGITSKKMVEKTYWSEIIIENGLEVVEKIKKVKGNTPTDETENAIYTWQQLSGQITSTTGTIYGIYDLRGGLSERTAAYIANGSGVLQYNGSSIAYDEKNNLKQDSTEYVTVYPYDSNNDTDKSNYLKNTRIFGDAIRETSIYDDNSMNTAWFRGMSRYLFGEGVFWARGSGWSGSWQGSIFTFSVNDGQSNRGYGFRAILVAK